jgi:glutathione S-transferase
MTEERTLYYANGSIPNWRVLLALHSKGLVFTGERLKLMGAVRETRSPEFLAINPRGQTPVLVDGDITITESYAILQYLEARYPDPSLLPANDACGLARMLSRTYEAETFACAYEPIEMLFAVRLNELSVGQRDSIVAAVAAVDFDLGLWEARAAEASFIAGELFTLADCAFYPTLAYMLRRGLSLAKHPHLDAYHERVQALPAAVAAHPEGWVPDRTGKPDLFALARGLAAGL